MTLWTPNNWQKEHFWPTFSIYFLVMAVTRILPFMENNRTENKSANGRRKKPGKKCPNVFGLMAPK